MAIEKKAGKAGRGPSKTSTRPNSKKHGPSPSGSVEKSRASGSKPKSIKDFTKKKGGADGKRKPYAKQAKPKEPKDYKASKPHFKLVEGLKMNWNVVRDRSTPEEERKKLLQQMMNQVAKKVHEVTLRHDASRMVQCLLQFGTDSQKEAILAELLPKLHEIAKTPYGHFTVLKAVAYCNQPATMKRIVAALQKHFVSLSTHVIGARTVESVTQLYPANLVRSLKGELYGKNFSILCPEPPKSLANLLQQVPTKRESVLDHMRDLIIQKFVTKTLLEFTYTHHLLWEYVQQIAHIGEGDQDSTPSDKDRKRMEELVGQLADQAPKLLSTKPGAKAMSVIINQATAKDRKRVLKSLKGHCLESLLHDSAFMGIIRLVDVTDDTVNVQKTIFDELKASNKEVKYSASGDVLAELEAPWLRITQHKNAHKLLLRLLVPQRRCFEPDEAVIFNAAMENTKKDASLKRKEHLLYIRDSLLRVLRANTERLVRCKIGSRVIEAAMQAFHDDLLAENIARVYCGVPVEQEEGEEMDEEVVEEEEGEDEEEEEDDEENEEEYEGEEEEEMEGDEGGEEEEDVDVEEDEEYQQQMEEAAEDRRHAKAGGKEAAQDESEWLPIEEDVAAHSLIKRLLQWESANERHHNPEAASLQLVDKLRDSLLKPSGSHGETKEATGHHKHAQEFQNMLANWDTSLWSADESGPSFPERMWSYLTSEDREERPRICQWLHCNRACYALVELAQVSSICSQQLKSVLPLVAQVRAELDEEALGSGQKLFFAFCDQYEASLSKPKAKKGAASSSKLASDSSASTPADKKRKLSSKK